MDDAQRRAEFVAAFRLVFKDRAIEIAQTQLGSADGPVKDSWRLIMRELEDCQTAYNLADWPQLPDRR